MNTYERSGSALTSAPSAGASFLDRGKLERLVDAEAQYGAPTGPPPPACHQVLPQPAGLSQPLQQRGYLKNGLFGGGHRGQRRGHH